MPIKVTCPKCQGVLHAPDDAGGKRGKCPTCGTVLAIPADAPKAAPEPTPFGSFTSPPAPAAAPKQSSFSFPSADEGHRESPTRLPPPSDEPRRHADPFAKPGRPPVAADAVDEKLIRSWRKTRRGLGWVQAALFFLLLSVLGYAGIAIAENYGTKLPSQSPGYLQLQGLSSDTEIRVGAVLVPAALGLLFLMLGRLGVSNAPRSSYARGLSSMASIATIIGMGGLVAFAVPTGGQIAAGFFPTLPADPFDLAGLRKNLLDPTDINGMLQRFGLAVTVTFLPLAWLWFVSGLGRMGAALHDDRLASRGTRLLVYVGLVFIVVVIGRIACVEYTDDVNKLYGEHVRPHWDKLGEHRPAVVAGLIGLAGLIGWWWYAALVGSARRAIREWLDRNAV